MKIKVNKVTFEESINTLNESMENYIEVSDNSINVITSSIGEMNSLYLSKNSEVLLQKEDLRKNNIVSNLSKVISQIQTTMENFEFADNETYNSGGD